MLESATYLPPAAADARRGFTSTLQSLLRFAAGSYEHDLVTLVGERRENLTTPRLLLSDGWVVGGGARWIHWSELISM